MEKTCVQIWSPIHRDYGENVFKHGLQYIEIIEKTCVQTWSPIHREYGENMCSDMVPNT